MKLSSTFVLSLLMAPSIVSCAGYRGSCVSLLFQLNKERESNNLDRIDEEAFIKAVGGNDECQATLQKIYQYSEKDVGNSGSTGSSWKLSREQIKTRISRTLRGKFPKQIVYDPEDPYNWFFMHLKNYFADDTRNDQLVTVEIRKLSPANLNPNNPFQTYSFEPGEIGESDFMVPVITIPGNLFSKFGMYHPNPKLQLRHLDLMMASLVSINSVIPDDSAVLVSGFQSTSSAFGQPLSTGLSRKDRKILFLDAQKQERSPMRQYQWEYVNHELTKAMAGFSAIPRHEVIETLWLSNGDDQKLRLLIQLVAAAQTGHKIVFRIPRPEAVQDLPDLIQFLEKVTRRHPQTVLKVLQQLNALAKSNITLDSAQGSQFFLNTLDLEHVRQRRAYAPV